MSFRRRGSFAKNLRSIEPDLTDFIPDGGITAASRNQWYFEIAWEVANKGECVGHGHGVGLGTYGQGPGRKVGWVWAVEARLAGGETHTLCDTHHIDICQSGFSPSHSGPLLCTRNSYSTRNIHPGLALARADISPILAIRR